MFSTAVFFFPGGACFLLFAAPQFYVAVIDELPEGIHKNEVVVSTVKPPEHAGFEPVEKEHDFGDFEVAVLLHDDGSAGFYVLV